jgi:hypothetical protein
MDLIRRLLRLPKYSAEVLRAVSEGKAEIDEAGNVGWMIP